MRKDKILMLTKYTQVGPSSRYRYYNYVSCFEDEGFVVRISSFFASQFLRTHSRFRKSLLALLAYFFRFIAVLKLLIQRRNYQLVIVEYELFPYFPSVFEYLLKWRGIPFIVDYDDAIFHRYDQHKNPLVRFLLKNKISKVMNYASALVVGNDYLQSYARKFNNRIMQLPTVVLLDKYKKAQVEFNNKSQEKNKNFVIGWIGSKSTSHYIIPLLASLKQMVDLHDNVVCHFIGFDQNLLSKKEMQECKIIVIPWSEQSEIEEILKFDVGIMPLSDNPWARGKCGFKLIQYMSCKKPVIASPVGVNKTIVENGVNGFLATSSEQWLQAFVNLYQNESLRESMSVKSWKKINELFSHEKNCQQYMNLINETIEDNND